MKSEDIQFLLAVLWLALTGSGTWIGYLLRHQFAPNLGLVTLFSIVWTVLSMSMGAGIQAIGRSCD